MGGDYKYMQVGIGADLQNILKLLFLSLLLVGG